MTIAGSRPARTPRPRSHRPTGSRTAAVLAAALLAVAPLAACSQGGEEPSASPSSTLSVEVAGEVGVRPSLTIPEGLTVNETSTATLIEGTGPALVEGQTILLDYLAVDIETGETTLDTFSVLPEIRSLTADSLGGPLHELLSGATIGSRLERVELGTKSNPNPHVLVVDVLPLTATGEEMPSDPSLPAVTRAEDGTPTVTIPEAAAPHQMMTTTLIKGTGPQVGLGQSVLLQLSAVRWEDGAVVDTTWGAQPRAVAVNDLPRGLAGGLVEQTEGSQVLVVVPPEDGNGVDTLVYVIDILATADIALRPSGTEHQVPEPTVTPEATPEPTTEPTTEPTDTES